jgi:hypothetical protein
MGDFTKDKFKKYRSSQSTAVVGIAMDFTYVKETQPKHKRTDSPENDALRTVRYYYDLELDNSDNIIGGEWYTNRHPDFLWVAEPDAKAESIAEDEAIGEWDGSDMLLPKSWRKAAIRASQEGQPLGKIVNQMFSWAQSD